MRALVFIGFIAVAAGAQAPSSPSSLNPTGSITGRVIDLKTGEGLSDVSIHIQGTSAGAISGVGGRFFIGNIPAGQASLLGRRIGYAAKAVTGIVVKSGTTIEQDLTLAPASVQLATQVVSAYLERGTVNSALDKQRSALGITSSITSEQITKSPDRDAAQAVQRVSGVTVQGGRYVFVRGLGERYTTTALNGARLPSPEPEKKTVPLDLFPSSLLQSITTSKTFTPDLAGDFSGAAVNLETKEFPTQSLQSYTFTAGYNSAATGRSILQAPHVGAEWLASGGSDRKLPDVVLAAGSLRGLSLAQSNAVVRSFRNVWTPVRATGNANGGFGFTSGGQSTFLGNRFGFIASGSYSNSQEARVGEVRARAVPSSNTEQRSVNVTTGTTGRESVLMGGIVNLSTILGQRSKISLNNMYDRSSDNEAHADSGYLEFGTEANTKRSTLTFIERAVRSNQLRGDHTLGSRQQLDWSATSSAVTRREPDRADLVYVQQMVNGKLSPFALDGGTDDGAKRSFGDLREHSWDLATNYRLALGSPEKEARLKFGGELRTSKRDVIARSYSIYANLTAQEASASAEDVFRKYSTETSAVFTPINNSAAGSYIANDRVSAGYGMFDLPLGARMRLVGGARAEIWNLRLTTERLFANDHNSATPSATDVLPSLALNVRLGESQNLRFSATRTLSRPEYREVSPLLSREVIGEVSTIGNPDLRRALIDNYDVRWEMYPGEGELLSVALFGKNFHSPIEKVEVATSGGTNYSFVNADGASNYGVEIETRKRLSALGEFFAPLSLFANSTLMHSRIQPGNGDISALTSDSRPMVGQAGYVVNAGLSWQPASSRASATILFNTVGKRITAAASKPLPDTYEMPRNILDLSLQVPLGSSLTARMNARNLLDSPYVERQGSVTRLSYTSGRVFTLGFNLQR